MEKPGAAGRWTEIVGVIGVVASLVFVGIEVRQNTQAVRGATYQSLVESSMSLLFYMADHPELDAELDAWGRGEELPPEERTRVESIVLAYLRHLENAYFQREEGTLKPELLENWSGNPALNTPHFREFWQQRRGAFSDGFRRYFEARWGQQ